MYFGPYNFCSEILNSKISQVKGMQRTTPDGSGAQTSTQCTRTLNCLLSLFCFLFLWLRNKICFAGVEGTQTTRLIRMNNKISYLQGLQRTTSDGSGTQIFTQSTRTLCLPPITFLLMWLWNDIHFGGVEGTKNMNHKKSHL